MAAQIPDDEKKIFCETALWAWHGEFARLIMARALTYGIDYRLIVYDAFYDCPRAYNAKYSMILLENAKAQFKCDLCRHCWTSMRARCSFHISKPDEGAIILLKLFTQQCQYCLVDVSPLWYFGTVIRHFLHQKISVLTMTDLTLDEICRVMKNLAKTICERYLPDSMSSVQWDVTHNGIQSVRRLYQRKGLMLAQHNPKLCEACHLGACYE